VRFLIIFLFSIVLCCSFGCGTKREYIETDCNRPYRHFDKKLASGCMHSIEVEHNVAKQFLVLKFKQVCEIPEIEVRSCKKYRVTKQSPDLIDMIAAPFSIAAYIVSFGQSHTPSELKDDIVGRTRKNRLRTTRDTKRTGRKKNETLKIPNLMFTIETNYGNFFDYKTNDNGIVAIDLNAIKPFDELTFFAVHNGIKIEKKWRY